MRATAAGRELIGYAERTGAEADRAVAAMRRFRDSLVGRVQVGASLTAMVYRLPPILRKLRADYPGIDVILANMPSRGRRGMSRLSLLPPCPVSEANGGERSEPVGGFIICSGAC